MILDRERKGKKNKSKKIQPTRDKDTPKNLKLELHDAKGDYAKDGGLGEV